MIALVLTVIRYPSTSVAEAQASVSQLSAVVLQLIESNAKRSQSIKDEKSHSRFPRNSISRSSLIDNGESSSAVQQFQQTYAEHEPNQLLPSLARDNDTPVVGEERVHIHPTHNGNAADGKEINVGLSFEEDLKISRPYMRALKRCSDWTVSSSIAPSMGWSFFSGKRLAEVSSYSVINLPISPQDLWNGHRYSAGSLIRQSRASTRPIQKKTFGRLVRNTAMSSSTSSATIVEVIDYISTRKVDFKFGTKSKVHNGNKTLGLFGTGCIFSLVQ